MQRLWLLFAQTVTIGLALWFIVASLKPQWVRDTTLGKTLQTETAQPVSIREAVPGAGSSSDSYRHAAEKAMPSVVNIYTTTAATRPAHPLLNDPFFRRFFGDQYQQAPERQFSLGSGVIVSPQGYIMTNNHVIEAAQEIEVAFADGRKAAATLVGTDPETDLAVIKIDMQDVPAISFGHVDEVKVGDVVLAIGNPFGVGQTVTMGIISALGRNQLGINTFENFIQTDAAINPGNSGGALIDTSGNLLGINTAIYSRTGGSLGIGFAIPVTTVKTVMESIIKTGQVTRGWIGVELQDITPEMADSFGLQKTSGAIIAGVIRGGPAERAGMRPGDILLSVNGEQVDNTTELLHMIAQLQPGAEANLSVLRQNGEAKLEVKIGRRPPVRHTVVE